MIPALVEVGAHRAECHSMEGHAEAHAWLELLGAEREGVRPRFGKNGEGFVCFSWRRENVHRRENPESKLRGNSDPAGRRAAADQPARPNGARHEPADREPRTKTWRQDSKTSM